MEKQNWSYGTGGNGGLAQLGEHLPCKQGVESSNLLVSIGAGRKRRKESLYLENRILKNLKYQRVPEAFKKRGRRAEKERDIREKKKKTTKKRSFFVVRRSNTGRNVQRYAREG